MARVRLTPSQKDEIRKLTQFANRRIRSAQKEYAKAGKMILPQELAGHTRMREDWTTAQTPLSRSVVFESERDYREHIQFLRRFRRNAPTVKEYTQQQHRTTLKALETSLGESVPMSLRRKLNEMSAPELADFWRTFSNKASRLGLAFSSLSAMQQTMEEFFGEDYESLLS